MTYKFNLDTNIQAFDEFAMNSNQNSLFQNTTWATIKNNWDHLYTSVTKDDEIVGVALVLIRRMPLGLSLFYIPRGPIMDYSNHELVSFYFDNLKKEAKKQHAIALRFDPAIISRLYMYENRNDDHEYQNNDVIDYLKSIGAKHKGFTTMIEESTQPRYNAAMTIKENVRSTVNRKTIKRVDRCLKSGVKKFEGVEYIDDFATAMHYTEVRKGVALRNKEYFKHMVDTYGDHAICLVAKLNLKEEYERISASIKEKEELLKGELTRKKRNLITEELNTQRKELEKTKTDLDREDTDEVITCGILGVYNKNLMELFYMGNNPYYLRTFSSYMLYETCIERCEELGIKRCSFGGIEGTLDDGLTLFKSNWPMEVEEYIGEFNFVLNPFMYTMFDKVYPFVLKMAAKRKGKN